MSKSLKNLIIVTLFLGSGLIVSTRFFSQNTNEIVSNIEYNFSEEWQSLHSESNKFKQALDSGNFDLSKFAYPALLYQDKQLIAWNNNEFEFADFKNALEENLIISSNEKGILAFESRNFTIDTKSYNLITSVPVVRTYPIHNKYLESILNPRIIPKGVVVSAKKSEVDYLPIRHKEKIVFFVSPPFQQVFKPRILLLIQVLTVLFIVSLFTVLFQLAFEFSRKGNIKSGFVFLICSILIVRSLMLLFNFPNTFLHTDLFRSTVFIASDFNNSLGELFLNSACLCLMVTYLVFNKKFVIDWFNKKSRELVDFFILICLTLLGFLLLKIFFDLVFNLLTNAQFPLDIFSNIEISYLSIFAYLSILLFGLAYFFIIDLIFKVILAKVKLKVYLQSLLVVNTILMSISIAVGLEWILLIIAQNIYFFLLFKYKFPERLAKLKFGTFLYGLLAIFLLAFTSASAVYRSHEFKELNKKEKLATKLLIDRDVEGEYLLDGMLKNIVADVFINSLLVNPQSPKQQIIDRIERYFSSGYFDNYNVKIDLFDRKGNRIYPSEIAQNIDSIKYQISKQYVSTDYDNIYFEEDNSDAGKRRYVCLMDFQRYENKTGYVILNLNLKKQISKSVYPELLLEHRFIGKNDFDYAVYNIEGIVHNIGSFNYKSDFNQEWFDNNKIYNEGLEHNGIHHFAVKGNNKTIVITSEVYSYWAILSNFSFYFLLILFGAILLSIINSLITPNNDKSLSFSTKILIYIGCAFAIPITFVGFAVINTINTSYKTEIEKSYEKKTIAIGEGLVGLLKKYNDNSENKESITNEVSKISKSTRSDISLYDLQGKLITTSQPKIFESGLLTITINPIAYQQIIFGKKDKIILDESIGNLEYKSSFIAIRDTNDGTLLGIMSSPFFGSKNHLNRQKAEVFNNIINITTLIFIFSVWFTYLAVRRLTNPLMVIASKLKSTELKEINEPLKWKTNDEIGVLIQEYNKMVEKLEVSKIELAKNEKEAAWREMAKQVAHEIKNPLTPMKLTLQHLNRVMEQDDIRRKPLNTLLSQVDTLDEIVTSFSHFAKMPDPQNAIFDLKDELEKIIDLHPEKNIIMNNNASQYKVLADKKLFGRIFNNIILNAFQSMIDIGNPELKIELKNESDKMIVSFSDRGSGISEEIAEKVFIPNFSTKDSGSGIGLAVAKRGIEHAGGRIYFESKIGKGTIFYIEVPVLID